MFFYKNVQLGGGGAGGWGRRGVGRSGWRAPTTVLHIFGKKKLNPNEGGRVDHPPYLDSNQVLNPNFNPFFYHRIALFGFKSAWLTAQAVAQWLTRYLQSLWTSSCLYGVLTGRPILWQPNFACRSCCLNIKIVADATIRSFANLGHKYGALAQKLPLGASVWCGHEWSTAATYLKRVIALQIQRLARFSNYLTKPHLDNVPIAQSWRYQPETSRLSDAGFDACRWTDLLCRTKHYICSTDT